MLMKTFGFDNTTKKLIFEDMSYRVVLFSNIDAFFSYLRQSFSCISGRIYDAVFP